MGRVTAELRHFHRDQRGDALEYALVVAVFALPMIVLMERIKDILTDYYSMIAFFLGWPFL